MESHRQRGGQPPGYIRQALSKAREFVERQLTSAVTGVMTFVLGLATGRRDELSLELGLTASCIMLFCLCLFIWIGFIKRADEDAASVKEEVDALKGYVPFQVKVHRNTKVASAFVACGARAEQAEREIMIVGPHFEEDPVSSRDHNDYLVEHITATVQRHASIPSPFKYTRLLQLSADDDYVLRTQHGDIPRSRLRDAGTIDHISQVLSVGRQHGGRIEIDVRGRKFVPSFPSILIVDDHHMFFSLLTAGANDGVDEGEGAAGDGHVPLDFNLVLEIEDRDGGVISVFKEVVKHLAYDAQQVKRVVSDSVRASDRIQKNRRVSREGDRQDSEQA